MIDVQGRHRLRRMIPGVAAVAALVATLAAHGATYLDFPSPADFAAGHLYAWRWGSSYLMEDPSLGPFTFSYAIADDFLANQAPQLSPQAARQAVTQALSMWEVTSGGFFTFTLAPWSAVMNQGGAPPDQWEGPSVDEWLSGDFPGVYPGWGANFEFFSVPTGFTLDSQGVQYQMAPNNLGFTVVNRVGSTHIVSVDIYLNEDFTWADLQGDDDSSENPDDESLTTTYDVGTVLLHELGHALGLDHPNQSTANGSWNLDPYSYASGAPWSSDDLMYSFYQGVRTQPTIDEVGGIACLYGLPSPIDLDGDGVVTGGDIADLLVHWGAQGLGSPGDLNFDGVINGEDLAILLQEFGVQPEPPSSDESTLAPDTGASASPEPVEPLIFDCYDVAPNGAKRAK